MVRESGKRRSTEYLVTAGEVPVDSKVESRKTCKIRAGQAVGFGDVRIRIIAAV